MSDPHRLSITLTLPNGQEYRWSPDEQRVENVPSGLTFGTTIPGLFSVASFTLPRGIIKDYPDEALFADVKVNGSGGRRAWEGRVASLPREQGSSRTLTVGAVGWAAHLKDQQAFREVYVDTRLSAWQDIPITRLADHAASNISTADFSWTTNGKGGLSISYPNQLLPSQTIAETVYENQSIKIASIMYQATSVNPPASYIVRFRAADSIASGGDTYSPAFDDTLRTMAITTPRDFLTMYVYSNGAASTPAVGSLTTVSQLAVYGTHGLTSRANGTGPDGFYASDLIADIVRRTAPLLTVGDIEQTSYVIPQAVYDGVDGETALLDVNKYELLRWGVGEDRVFSAWRANPDTRTVWEARLSEGAQVQLEGDNAESVINGVIVRYTDPYGKARVIAPTGYTPADTTSANLLITDTSNAATAAGLQKYPVLNLSFSTDAAGAEQIGAVYLAEQNLPQRRGTINLTGLVRHPELGPVPAWMVRAGDFIRIADRPNDPPREITATGYTHDAHTVSATVGGLPQTIEALLERVGVRTTNL